MTDPTSNPPLPSPESIRLRLKTQLGSLDSILRGASDRALGRRPADGKWSAREHLAHLGRYHEVFLERLDRMLAERGPQFGRYRTESDPGAAPWFRLPVPELLERMRGLRALLVARVEKLAPGEWQLTGVHPAFGQMPIALWLEFFLLHEGHHLYAILKCARAGPS